jgi:hypothetical protein
MLRRYYVCGRKKKSLKGANTLIDNSLIHGDVIVCAGPNHPSLYSNWLMVRRKDFNWLLPESELQSRDRAECTYELMFKARYSQKPQRCIIRFVECAEDEDRIYSIENASCTEYSHIRIDFVDGPERAVTVGQIAALYRRPIIDVLGNSVKENGLNLLSTMQCIGGGKICANGTDRDVGAHYKSLSFDGNIEHL